MTRPSLAWRTLLTGAVLPLILAGGAFAAGAPQVIGIAAAVVNDVRIRASTAAQPLPAVVRQRVALGNQVQTGGASRLQLQLLDRSAFTVGANARLTIDRFVYDPAGSSMTATVAKGAFRFMSGRSGSRGSSITTPVASIGIRGTILDGVVGPLAVEIARGERGIGQEVEADPERATLVILRGPGAGREGNATVGAVSVTAAGTAVDLTEPLQAAYVPRPGAVPIGPFTISLSGLARLNETILPPQQPLLPSDGSGSGDFVPGGDYDRGGPYYRVPGPGGFGGDGFGVERDRRGSGDGFGNGPAFPGGSGALGIPRGQRPPRNITRPEGQDTPRTQPGEVPDRPNQPMPQPSGAPQPSGTSQPSEAAQSNASPRRLYLTPNQSTGKEPSASATPAPASDNQAGANPYGKSQ